MPVFTTPRTPSARRPLACAAAAILAPLITLSAARAFPATWRTTPGIPRSTWRSYTQSVDGCGHDYNHATAAGPGADGTVARHGCDLTGITSSCGYGIWWTWHSPSGHAKPGLDAPWHVQLRVSPSR
jgi:hypothetical protein